ncbi:hypothetical protein ACIO3O_34970 [Streptomyces sp. NPDC087440]|uniref:hypothetical protein n=1 Tax=Streptomyces sp. NPDC087440 TaxID=3365790 RepID=UPI00381F97FF
MPGSGPDPGLGPPVRSLFRDVVTDRMLGGQLPPQAAMLYEGGVDPSRDGDAGFLADFLHEFLHQDTCTPVTADGVPLLAVLAADDRVPPQQRYALAGLLLSIATVTERHLAESWPRPAPHADPDSEQRARQAVELELAGLLARWGVECPAVRLALAGLAVVFPMARTLPALSARLWGCVDRYPEGTDLGDYVRFVLVLAARDDHRTLAALEAWTDIRRQGTARQVPVRARALHLLEQMFRALFQGRRVASTQNSLPSGSASVTQLS